MSRLWNSIKAAGQAFATTGNPWVAVAAAGTQAMDDHEASKERRREQAYNERMRDEERAYNSPAAQMSRLQEAGLNPNLIYGSGNVTGNTSSGSPEYVSSNKYSKNPVDWLAIKNADLELQMKEKQLAQMDKNESRFDLENQYRMQRLAYNDKMMDYQLKQAELNYQRNKHDYDLVKGTKMPTNAPWYYRLFTGSVDDAKDWSTRQPDYLPTSIFDGSGGYYSS